jgi:hypothetical protein
MSVPVSRNGLSLEGKIRSARLFSSVVEHFRGKEGVLSSNLRMGFAKLSLMAPREIRIAVNVKQRTQGGIPVQVWLRDQDDKEVAMYLVAEEPPATQPVTFDSGGGKFYVAEGGEYIGRFKWNAADDEEREFEEPISVPSPPECPNCLERVPTLVDYVCESCRFG